MSLEPLEFERLLALARAGDLAPFRLEAVELEAADLADVLSALEEDERLLVVRALPPDISGEALAEMPDDLHPEDTLAALESAHAADIVEEMEDDDAADIIGDLEPEDQERILREVEDRTGVDRLLRYHEETAGGLMTTAVVTVAEDDTVGQALVEVREQVELQELDDIYQVFVVDRFHHLLGTVSFQALVVTPPDRPVREVMEEPEAVAPPDLDQEEVARLMARYNLPSLPVVEEGGKLLGRVTFDDVIDVVEAETTEDLMRFSGVSPDEELGATWQEAVRSRAPWLMLNLVTASAAASVVFFFEESIRALSVLAVFMPVVAGMGGNAGTQALAVTVRRLALGQVPRGRARSVVGKEMVVGLLNGFMVAVVMGGVAALVGGASLGGVVFLAMTGNLFVAGLMGAFVPILLSRVGVDPAIASSIFVTTFTDMVGFFLLLGLASQVLL